MKLFLLVTLFSLNTFAMPKVGDYAKFIITFKEKNGTKTETIQELKILSKDVNNMLVLENKRTDHNGVVTIETDPIREKDLFSDAQLEHYIKKCEDIGGHSRRIEVPAGKFKTCRYDEISGGVNGHAWIAIIPFGFIKYEMTHYKTGKSEVRELIQYSVGK